jgi:hypothetical protein
MNVISKAAEKKPETWRLPARNLGTDLGRMTLLE